MWAGRGRSRHPGPEAALSVTLLPVGSSSSLSSSVSWLPRGVFSLAIRLHMYHTKASHTLYNGDSLLLQIPQASCYIPPADYCWSLNADWLDSPFGVKLHHRLLSGQCNGYSLVSCPSLVKFIKANVRGKVKWCGQVLSPQRGLEGWCALIAAQGRVLLVCFILNKFVFIQSLVHSNANPTTKGLKRRTSIQYMMIT